MDEGFEIISGNHGEYFHIDQLSENNRFNRITLTRDRLKSLKDRITEALRDTQLDHSKNRL